VKHTFFYFILFFSSTAFFSCKSEKHKQVTSGIDSATKVISTEHFDTGKIYPSVNISSSAESFALYLPHQYKDSTKLSAIVFFDPHGDGSFPLSKYKSLADSFGVVLFGSNNSKNGLTFEETNHIADNLITEASSRFKIDPKLISLAGFSGGSRAALSYAFNHPELNTIIYCGAAMPAEQIKPLPPALGIAGKHDMNYTEVINLDNALEKLNSNNCLIEWNGKHEWSGSSVFKDAFAWSLFNAMKKKLVRQDDELVQKFIKDNSKSLSNVYDEELRLRKIIVFANGLTDISAFERRRNELLQSISYKKISSQRQESFELESRMKQNYVLCLDSKDIKWWQEEIRRMRKLKAGNERDMYERLLSYLSLACYSFSNTAIMQGNSEQALKILAIYKIADPENSDRAFLESCLYARQNDDPHAILLLNEAVHLGLRDKSKIENEESFSRLKNTNGFREVLNKIQSEPEAANK
jgi:predicted esterase